MVLAGNYCMFYFILWIWMMLNPDFRNRLIAEAVLKHSGLHLSTMGNTAQQTMPKLQVRNFQKPCPWRAKILESL
ncbi:hypothetical protein HanIR_Chr01g0009201 [Helianthus annuus]|nr:hypothetical protein HanIR_Chr01g0009201 [Helianthus annuus]